MLSSSKRAYETGVLLIQASGWVQQINVDYV